MVSQPFKNSCLLPDKLCHKLLQAIHGEIGVFETISNCTTAFLDGHLWWRAGHSGHSENASIYMQVFAFFCIQLFHSLTPV